VNFVVVFEGEQPLTNTVANGSRKQRQMRAKSDGECHRCMWSESVMRRP
jgi:hypothetical protein